MYYAYFSLPFFFVFLFFCFLVFVLFLRQGPVQPSLASNLSPGQGQSSCLHLGTGIRCVPPCPGHVVLGITYPESTLIQWRQALGSGSVNLYEQHTHHAVL